MTRRMEEETPIGQMIDLGICGGCIHFFVEEVDYDYFVATDMTAIAVPEGEEPPAIACFRSGKLETCPCTDECGDYSPGDPPEEEAGA